MFSARREGRKPCRGVGEVVGVDMGMGMGRHTDGGTKLPKNWWAMASEDSE